MKRIVLALNPGNINKVAIDFGCYLSNMAKSKVTGAFVDRLSEEEQYAIHRDGEKKPPESGTGEIRHKDLHLVRSHFSEACICRDASYALHTEPAITPERLIAETRFCDVLILDPALSQGHEIEAAPSAWARHILLQSECPVILAPESFNGITDIIFTYDGSAASVKAIKQFTYLFPEFSRYTTTILEINAGKSTLADEAMLREWFRGHYDHVEHVILQGDLVGQLITYLLPRNNAFVVMGAYGRNFFSRLIKGSTAEPLSGTIINPIFIAH